MKTRFFALLYVILLPSAFAQQTSETSPTAPVDTTEATELPADTVAMREITIDATGKTSFAQTGFRNWAEGGINSLAIGQLIEAAAQIESERWLTKYDVRLGFGLIKQDTLAFRKSEDVIRINASWAYTGPGMFRNLSPTLAMSFRSQFAAGLNHDKDPTGQGRTLPVKVSDLLAPATTNQSIGLSYRPSNVFRTRLGLASKQTIVAIERLRPLYALQPDQFVRVEAGLESVSEFDKEVVTNVRWKSQLSVFSAVVTDIVPDVMWENYISMRVNSWLQFNSSVLAIFDRDITSEIQFKEVFGIGLAITFI